MFKRGSIALSCILFWLVKSPGESPPLVRASLMLEMRFVHCFSLLLIDVLHASYSLGVDNECN